jgi:hypothetical protein
MSRRRADERHADGRRATDRAQTNLAVLGVALLLVTTVAGVSLAVADGALAGADREPLDRRAAVAVADRLVAADAPITTRGNVLNRSSVLSLTAGDVDRLAPSAQGRPLRVMLDDRTLAERGDPTEGVTIRRVVLLSNRTTESRTVALADTDSVTLPRRTPRATLRIAPNATTTVETVRANGRVVLHNDSGLSGEYTVTTSRFETTRVTLTTADSDPAGSVTVNYYPARTTKAVLEVTVGGR